MTEHLTTHRARTLRKNMTDAEQALWQPLRRKQLPGSRFRRQAPIGPYIVDFVSFGERLIVELDGGQHAEAEQIEHDRRRTEFLERAGFRVLRFWNHEVLRNMEGVLARIVEALEESRLPPPRGGRGQPGPKSKNLSEHDD